MTKKTLNDFGSGITQDINSFTIPKNIFSTLTATTTNTIQQLFTAILLKAASIFTSANRTNNSDETIVILNDSFTYRTETTNGTAVTYKISTYRVQLYALVPDTSDDPDNY